MKTKIDKDNLARREARIEQEFSELCGQATSGQRQLTAGEKSLLAAWGIGGSSLRVAKVVADIESFMGSGSFVDRVSHAFGRGGKAERDMLAARLAMVENFEHGLAAMKSANDLEKQGRALQQILAMQEKQRAEAMVEDATRLSAPMKVHKPIALAHRR
jgi:hypothetical protein